MRKALAKEQEDHAITKKAHIALKKEYCDLDKKHKELELQYGILWDSVSTKFCPVLRAHEQVGRLRSIELEIRLASA